MLIFVPCVLAAPLDHDDFIGAIADLLFREANQRVAAPIGVLAPSQSIGKKAAGRKRHILTDTLGLLLGVPVHPAQVQDRDGAEPLLHQARRQFSFIERVIGDAGYHGPKIAAAIQ